MSIFYEIAHRLELPDPGELVLYDGAAALQPHNITFQGPDGPVLFSQQPLLLLQPAPPPHQLRVAEFAKKKYYILPIEKLIPGPRFSL